jgi:uncharacterized protein
MAGPPRLKPEKANHSRSLYEWLKWYIFYTIYAGVEFEFDQRKSLANKVKHGIDFIEAQALWLDDALVEAPARTVDEPRFLAVGRIAGRHWSAVCARRGERTRIISVRRSRGKEIEAYESA